MCLRMACVVSDTSGLLHVRKEVYVVEEDSTS